MRQSAPRYDPATLGTVSPHFLLARLFFARLASAASRFSVRFFAAAFAALLARAERSSGVMFFAAVLPPILPKVRAISVMAARTSGGIFTLIPPIVHLSRYADGRQITTDFH